MVIGAVCRVRVMDCRESVTSRVSRFLSGAIMDMMEGEVVGRESRVRDVVSLGVGVVEQITSFMLKSTGERFCLQVVACLAGKLVSYSDG